MKKLLNASLAIAVLSVALISSCSKGSKGDTGAKGPAGPDSVYSSSWLSMTMHDSAEAANKDTVAVEGVFAPGITQGIIDSGVVVTYLGVRNSSGNLIEEDAPSNMEVTISAGYIYLRAFANYTGYGFRYVAIPGKTVYSITSVTGLTKAQIQQLTPDQLHQALRSANVSTN